VTGKRRERPWLRAVIGDGVASGEQTTCQRTTLEFTALLKTEDLQEEPGAFAEKRFPIRKAS
jgi:hypothetical protein